MTESNKNLASYFDHTNLKPDATRPDIIRLCEQAVQYKFYAVVVNPNRVLLAKQHLSGTDIKVVTVAGFPLGASKTEIKIKEAMQSVDEGAHEIDMVAQIGWIKEHNFTAVETEITRLRQSLPFNTLLKVIIETSLLTKEEQIESTRAVVNGGAQFVKTSTGVFGGATIDAVKTIKSAAEDKIEIKASGGIRTLDQCQQYINAGATRIGSSASVAIISQSSSQSS